MAACSWEATQDENSVDQQMPLMLQQIKADIPLRHRQMSERSVSMHEPRKRSASLRSASLSSADRQARWLMTSRAGHADHLGSTVAELEDERKRSLLEEDTLEKLNIDEDEDGSDVSYVLSRRSSYTDSLPTGLGNRVCDSVFLLQSLKYHLLTRIIGM